MLLLIALAGCLAPPSQLVCREGYLPVDDSCVKPRPESCNDGVDNDVDGLLDCEDDDCLGSMHCSETSCTDGHDEDGDGLVDCTDTDCWQDAACTVRVRMLAAAGSTSLTATTRADQFGIGLGCDQTFIVSSYSRFGVRSPTGQVAIEGGGGEPVTCTWRLDSSWVQFDRAEGPASYFEEAWPAERTGFVLDEDCPLRDSSFLPAQWFVSLEGGGRTAHAGGKRADPLWFTQAAGAGVPHQWSSTTPGPSDACEVRYLHHFTSSSGLPFEGGEVYTPAD